MDCKLAWLENAQCRPGRGSSGGTITQSVPHAELLSGEPALLAVERRIGRHLCAAARRAASWPWGEPKQWTKEDGDGDGV